MRKILLLLTALTLSCSPKQMKVESAPAPLQRCTADTVLEHVVQMTGCSEPMLYVDPILPFVYGYCADSGDNIPINLTMPVELYRQSADKVEADGGKLICIDNNSAIVQIPGF